MSDTLPSVDRWLAEARSSQEASECGMFLIHNGIVRQSPRAQVREGLDDGRQVTGMVFSYDQAKVDAAIEYARALPGIGYVRVWLNSGHLEVGDSIMLVLVGGDIRPHVIDGLQQLVGQIKSECVNEIEELS